MGKEKALLDTITREKVIFVYTLIAIGMVVLSTCTRAAESFSSPGLSPDESFNLVSGAVLDSGLLFGVGLVLLSQSYLLSVPRASGMLSLRLTGFPYRRRFFRCILGVSFLVLSLYFSGLIVTMILQLRGWRIEDRFLGHALSALVKVGMMLAVLMLAGFTFELLTGLPGPVGSLCYLFLTSELCAFLSSKLGTAPYIACCLSGRPVKDFSPVAPLECVFFAAQVLVLWYAGVISIERRDFC